MKKKYLLTALSTALILSACGSSSPSDVIIDDLNSKKISSTKDISNYLYDFYIKTNNNINRNDCTILKDNKKSDFDNMVINLSKEYCKKPKELNNKINQILVQINKEKSLSLKMYEIDGTQKYMEKGFNIEEAKILKTHNIRIDTLDDYKNLFKNKHNLVEFSKYNVDYKEARNILDLTKGLMSEEELIDWLAEGMRFYDINDWIKERMYLEGGMSARLEIIKIGIKKPYEWKKWEKVYVRTPEELKKWYSVGVKTPDGVRKISKYNININEYKLIKEAGIKLDELSFWNNVGLFNHSFKSGSEIYKILKVHNYNDVNKFKDFENMKLPIFDILYKAVQNKSMNEDIWKKFINNLEKQRKIIKSLGGSKVLQEWKGVPINKIIKLKEYGINAKENKEYNLTYNTNQLEFLIKKGYSHDDVIYILKTLKDYNKNILDTNIFATLEKSLNTKNVKKIMKFYVELSNLGSNQIRTLSYYNLLKEMNLPLLKKMQGFPFKYYKDLKNKLGFKSLKELNDFLIKNNIKYSNLYDLIKIKVKQNTPEEYRKSLIEFNKLLNNTKKKKIPTGSILMLNNNYYFSAKDIEFLLSKNIINYSSLQTKTYLNNTSMKFHNIFKLIKSKYNLNNKIEQKNKFIELCKNGNTNLYRIEKMLKKGK